MRPEAVLSEDQKRHRFRKMIRRRKEKAAAAAIVVAAATASAAPGDRDLHHRRGSSHSTSASSPEPSSSGEFLALTPPASSPETLCPEPIPHQIHRPQPHPHPPPPPPLKPKPNTAFRPVFPSAWPKAAPQESAGSFQFLRPAELAFLQLHRSNRAEGFSLVSSDVILESLYSDLQSQFRRFADSSQRFNSLRFIDRQILLGQNAPIFAAFCMVMYLAAGADERWDGERQLQVLFPHIDGNDEGPRLRIVTFGEFVRVLASANLPPSLCPGFLAELRSVLDMIGNYSSALNIEALKEAILLQQFGQNGSIIMSHMAEMNAVNRSVLLKTRELTVMMRVMRTIRTLKRSSSSSDQIEPLATSGAIKSSFWGLIRRKSARITKTILRHFEAHLDNLRGLETEKLGLIRTLSLIRLHFGSSLEDQMDMLGVRRERGSLLHAMPPLRIFRLSNTKPLLRRAIDEFEDLMENLRPFLLENEDEFWSLVLLATLWTGDAAAAAAPAAAHEVEERTRRAMSIHRAEVSEALVKLSPPGQAQRLIEVVDRCMNRAEDLIRFSDSFVCEDYHSGD